MPVAPGARAITAAFLAAFAVLSILAWFAYARVVDLRRDASTVENAQQTLASLWLVFATVTDAETAQRGYILTGDERFLGPFDEAVARVPAELATLRRLTAREPRQGERMARLAELVETRIAHSREVIALRRGQGFEAARARVAAGSGQALQDRIRSLVTAMTAAEESELDLDLGSAASSSGDALALIVGGSLVALLIVALCFLMVRRSVAVDAHAQAALEAANASLEARVAARTLELEHANARLADSARNLSTLVEQAPLSMALLDRDLSYLAASRRWIAEFGNGRDDLTGVSHYELHPDLPEHWRSAHARGLAGEAVHGGEERWLRGDGAERWLRWSVHPWHDASGGIGGIIVLGEDVTERRRLEQRQRLADAVFTNTQEAIVVTDLDCCILAVNPAFSVVSEYPESELIGQHMRIVNSGRHDPTFYQRMWNELAGSGAWQGEIWNRRKSGEVHQQWLAIGTVHGHDGRPLYYIGIGTDVSRMEHSETRLEYLARHDALTDLPNRVLLQGRLQHSLERARRQQRLCAVLYLDLDRFKAVNDLLGHARGDELLCLAAQRMGSRLRDVDTLARLGGDEFVIVLEDVTSRGDAERVAEDLVSVLCAPFTLASGHAVRIGASVGIAIFPGDAEQPEALLECADRALYAAKHSGGNGWRHASDLRAVRLPAEPIG